MGYSLVTFPLAPTGKVHISNITGASCHCKARLLLLLPPTTHLDHGCIFLRQKHTGKTKATVFPVMAHV